MITYFVMRNLRVHIHLLICWRGTCYFAEMLKGHMVRERLGTPGVMSPVTFKISKRKKWLFIKKAWTRRWAMWRSIKLGCENLPKIIILTEYLTSIGSKSQKIRLWFCEKTFDGHYRQQQFYSLFTSTQVHLTIQTQLGREAAKRHFGHPVCHHPNTCCQRP